MRFVLNDLGLEMCLCEVEKRMGVLSLRVYGKEMMKVAIVHDWLTNMENVGLFCAFRKFWGKIGCLAIMLNKILRRDEKYRTLEVCEKILGKFVCNDAGVILCR